jgi:hypothetical protein
MSVSPPWLVVGVQRNHEGSAWHVIMNEERRATKDPRKRIFLDVGYQDGGDNLSTENAPSLKDQLKARSIRDGSMNQQQGTQQLQTGKR